MLGISLDSRPHARRGPGHPPRRHRRPVGGLVLGRLRAGAGRSAAGGRATSSSTGRTRRSGASSASSPSAPRWSATTGRAPGLSDRTGPPPADRDAEVAVLAGVIDAVGADRVNLLGASSGCPVAATYAADHPDRADRLVLYGGYARGADIASPAAREQMVALVEAHWGLGSRVLADVFLPGANARQREAFAKFQRRSAPRELAAQALRSVYDLDVTDRLASVRCPTLVLHRRGDRAIPFALGRDLAERVPRARLPRALRRGPLPVARGHRRTHPGRGPLPDRPRPRAGRAPATGARGAALSERELDVLRPGRPRAAPTPRSPSSWCSACTPSTGTSPTSAPASA